MAQTRARAALSVAYLAVDLTSGHALDEEGADRLDQPVIPGSIIKIAALAAALESGVVTARSGVICSGRVSAGGHLLTCTHPNLHRPLTAAEALAHSCNAYFATVAARTPRSALDRALSDLGLPTTEAGVSIAAAALGVAGIRVAPRRLIDALAKIAANPSPLPWRPDTLAIVREGLHGAATYGTAAVLGARRIDAFAKTGTIVASGVSQGLVVGVTPRKTATVGFVALVSGGSGSDAAAIAAERLASRAAARTVRIGVARNDGGYDVRTMPLEDYVAGVVSGEAAGESASAIEALAIAVRTYTEANRGRHAREGFDLCDLTHCQVLRKATLAARRAANRTAGRVLLDKGRVATVFYTASCGGYTERPSNVWRGATDPAYLPSRRDEACEGTPRWSSDINARDLARALAAGRFRGDVLRSVVVASRTESGRVAWLQLDGLAPREISGDDFRTLVGRTLGWQHLKSTAFEVTRTGSGFHISGRGAGHGVGLCVVGSSRLAAKGASMPAILEHYFPGLIVGPLADAPSTVVEVVLPSAERDEAAALRAMARRALDALSSELGVSAPARVVLRFHPTVESYQRETKQPWFTAASAAGTTIDLLPPSALRQRGILESTLRHELVHVLTAAQLVGRPLWVKEGVASYYAGELATGTVASNCPQDEEFLAPASADALKRSFRRAAGCVAAQLAGGHAWRDLR